MVCPLFVMLDLNVKKENVVKIHTGKLWVFQETLLLGSNTLINFFSIFQETLLLGRHFHSGLQSMGTHDDHISFFFSMFKTLLNYHILKYGVPIKISCRTNVFIGCGNILSLYVKYGTVLLGLRFMVIFF